MNCFIRYFLNAIFLPSKIFINSPFSYISFTFIILYNLQKKVVQYAEINSIDKNTCVYGDLYTKEFLLKKDFTCFKNYSEIDVTNIRPFFAYKNVRNVKRSNPKDCKLIWNETYKYTFYNKDISVGTLWFCN